MADESEDLAGSEIAIIGLACRFPEAPDVRTYWENLRLGRDCISRFSDQDLLAAGVHPTSLARPNYLKVGGVVADAECFDAAFFGFSPRESQATDPQHRVFLECAWEALEDAGYDPETFAGAIGVYAGMGIESYLWNVYRSRIMELVGHNRVLLGNGKDHLPMWASFKLNLRGPSVNVNTACSSSLVAVHLACQSLLNGECDMALAGGVTISAQQRTGYLYEEGGILARDGVCRAFDAAASGTVPGNGAGVVLLKRLADALQNGDSIRAVIRGSAINNDGATKLAYTAPSRDGQVRAIAEALAIAEVDPRTIGYVEAHGTGTLIGDVVEVAALRQAFAQMGGEGDGYCAIGSVKPAIGHTDTAAGVAGLIKTVLSLEHGELPPSLHFVRENPEIDLAASPFYVNARLAPWPANGTPRRAGVSSFGIGGTNAHVVLEEAPPRSAASPSRPWQLLVVSARTSTALERATDRLAGFLASPGPGPDLADVAHTLQVGRRGFARRRMLVCRDVEEAARLLVARDPQRVLSAPESVAGSRSVAFLFPGQGAQHAGMARELYASEATLRERIDRGVRLLEPELGLDLRRLLFPAPEDAAAAAASLERTLFAQPALFLVEHALAELWMEWGIRPQAMIGHSIGEYTAACLAGVFSYEDGLRLVAARGRLMESLPEGRMVSVALPATELAGRLGDHLTLAAVNAPSLTVVSGPAAEVERLAGELSGEGVEVRPLRTSHAFHSAMMEPILGAFREEVGKVALKPPHIPYLSNLTGDWIAASEATDPDYWVRHLRRTVLFAAGLERLLASPAALLEVGPGRSLGSLAKRVAQPMGRQPLVLSSLPSAGQDEPALPLLLTALGRLWLAGAPVDWAGFRGEERRLRVPLPTYPFERKRYFIEAQPRGLEERPAPVPAALPEAEEPADDATASGIEALGRDVRPEHLAVGYQAPRTATERQIVALWEDLLGVERIGVYDGFFELGGHSLLLVQVIAGLRDLFHLSLPVADVAAAQTVAELATLVERRRALAEEEPGDADLAGELPVLVADPARRNEPFALTEVQEAYWIGRSGIFELGNVATHEYSEYQSDGVDIERLAAAWRALVDRHEMLRAVILPDGRQQILAEVPPYEIVVDDLRGLPAEVVGARLGAARRRMSHQVLPADRWPLFELRASRLGERLYRLHVSLDLLILDAWSVQILTGELLTLYVAPETRLQPIEVSFRDYLAAEVAFRDSAAYRRSLDYWRGRLASLPPAPDLPLMQDPATLAQPHFSRRAGSLDAESWRRLKARAARVGITPSAVLMAAFGEVLAAWSKSPRLLINLTLFNRLPIHPHIDRVVGDFTSLVLLAVDAAAPGSFEARAQRLQRQLWEDLEHRVVSGVRVLRELTRGQGGDGQLALAPVVFTSTLSMRPNAAGERPPAGEEAGASGLGENVFGVSQTPQVWIDQAVGEHNGALVFGWDVVEDLFPAGMMEAMFEAYRELLGRLAADLGAWEAEVPDLVPRRFLDLYAAANATAAPVPEGLLHGGFLEWAERAPERPAVIAAERTLTYGDLLSRARELGHRLRALGAQPNRLVAVVMEKGWEQVVAVLGILESGAAYLPIDAALPRERIWHLLERGEVAVAVTQPWIAERLEWPEDLARVVVGPEAPAGPVAPLAPVQGPGDLAYVIFTSGSTGTPKGVMIDHRGALNTIVDVNRRFSVDETDRVLGLAALSFDLSVYDVFGPLAVGGAVVLPEPWAAREPGRWAEWLASSGVTVWDSVPVLMEMLVEHLEGRAEVPGALRLVMMSGDWIPVSLPDRIRRLWPGVSVMSLGGATEASIWSIHYPIGEVEAGWKSIPYGRAMVSQTFQVLDERLEPRPVWVPGDLYIGGIGLALGYWRDAEKTAASFVVHPRTGERLYRTGDLGRWLPDGQIEFLGREDLQVKVQGHRIELGEIEAALVQHPAVRAGVIKAVGDQRGAKRLVAYVVPAAEPPVESTVAVTALAPLLDPIARLELKTRQPGLRRDLTGPEVDLRGEGEELGEDVVRSYALRRSFRKYLHQPLAKARLAGLLGNLRQIEWQGRPKYRYPSAGSLYPVQVYLQVKPGRVDGLAGGLYYYNPASHRLLLVTADEATDGALFGSDNRAIYEAAGFALFLVVDYQAILPIYGERARDFALLEAGYMGQLLMAAAPESEIGLCPIGGLDFAPIARRLSLHASHELVHSLLGGAINPAEALAGGNEADDYDLFLRLLAEEAATSPLPTAAQPQPSRPASVAGIAEQVRDFLRQRLPEHMIPGSFVLLTALPLSANGKVDRQALPEPEQDAATPAKTWVEPRDPLEAQIAELWRLALGVERLSVLDNFFELGGHSLAAARLVARVREVLSVDLPLAQLFQTPTVAAMAAAVAAQLRHPPAGPLPAVVLPAVVPDPESRYEPFPLTDLQHAYWIGRTGSFELGNLSPLYYAEIEMLDLSPARFARALERLTLRHGMLRAAVLPDGRQQIRPPRPLEVPAADLSALTPEGREAALAATRDELSRSFADPARDSLLAVRISRLDGRRYRVHMAVSLLICDAWSSGLLNRELRRLYGDPDAELPALELSFRDYVVALAAARGSAVYERALDYWRHRLASLPGAPSLPLARSPATLSKPRFVRRQTSLDAKRWGRIKQRAARAGLTPDALLCTVYAEVLASWSKERRFLLTVLYFNRLPLHPQVDAVLGNFSSTLLLEVDLTAPASLPEQAAKLQAQLWKDIEHGLVSGVQVLRELARAQGLGPRAAAPVVFASTVGLGGGEPAPTGSHAEPEDLVLSRLQTPQVWLDHQVHEANGALLASWDAVEDLFPPGLVDDMFAAYAGLLERLGDEDASAWQESFHPLLPEPQRARRLAVNATQRPVPAGLLDDGLGEQAARQPSHPAVVWRGGTIRYGELDRLATAIGQRLETLGAGPERIVAVVMEKGWEQVAAVYGVLRSGAAYLPVDPGLPRERIEYLLATCEVDLVLSQPWVSAAFSWPEGIRYLDVDAGFRAAATGRMLSRERSPEHLAYVIFTSGSTGQPKGVMIEHRAALNTIVDINSRFAVGPGDRVLALAALSFDLSVYDILGALTAGGTVVMAEPEIGREPGLLADWLEQAGVTIWDSVPAQMEMLVDRLEAQGALLPDSLRLVMMSGDWIPVGLPDRIKALRPGIEVVSLGGATEASIWSILHPITAVDRSRPSIPYGRPMVNQTFHVLDQRLEPCPEWTAGALYIGGIGLARGYYGDPERTAASFFVHPRTGERLYRTGDMGRFLPDGEIEFLGREDLQVKVQGYRIELGEIEAALTRHPAVRAAVATAVGERQGSKRLIAYVVAAQPDEPPSTEELRAFLQSILPSYMVPASFVVLAAIPLSANGKVDRAALGRLGAAEAKRAATERTEPRDEMELGLVQIWEEVLGRPAIGVTDDFFDLGGDSVLAVRLMGRVQRDFGRDLPLATLFENGTIERQAALLRGGDQGRRSPLVKIQPAGEGLPFFCVHPVGGNVLCYLELARTLGTERPFFGLQAPEPAAGDTSDTSVEALAARYLRELRAVQPAGPYLLGGWSMGAVVAFEMARQLPAGEVGLLAMIDVSAPNAEPLPEMPDEETLAAWFARDLASLAARPAPVKAEELRGLDGAERMELLTLRCQQANVLPEGFGAAELAQHFALFARNYRALLRYVPQPWDGHALLLQGMEGEAEEREACAGWRRLTRACHQEDVPGNHYTALRQPLVRVLGERLAATLAAVGAEIRRGGALAGATDLGDH